MRINWLAVTSATIILAAPCAHAQDSAPSPDGRDTVAIVSVGKGDDNGSGAQALVLRSRDHGERRLLLSRWNADYGRNLANLSHPLFSPDGGAIYFSSADASPSSAYVHRFDLKTDAVTPVGPGSVLRVMRTGPYKGDLLVQTHRYRYRPEGGSYNPVFLTRPSGRRVAMIPGSDRDDGEIAVDPWLLQKKWRAW
ncbi:MAG: hypothetical protein DI606_07000 [Sphingobium sp.]|uniref:hypothetical protein n=1 Tax=Sphingobium sp. TaxID=1912891 RepID=UPI000DB1CA71|nr:hypothetical protein [Sphingobium sp.]PZU13062.1 MAG: hypothetical protein DI606_07000 [Sphingobium sp.]